MTSSVSVYAEQCGREVLTFDPAGGSPVCECDGANTHTGSVSVTRRVFVSVWRPTETLFLSLSLSVSMTVSARQYFCSSGRMGCCFGSFVKFRGLIFCFCFGSSTADFVKM